MCSFKIVHTQVLRSAYFVDMINSFNATNDYEAMLRENLKNHRAEIHENILQFQCTLCSKEYLGVSHAMCT